MPLVPEHYRLHGLGFLDVSLVPEQQAQLPAAPRPPPSTVRQVSGQRTVIHSQGRWSARPRVANNPQANTEAPEPKMATPGVNLDALANLQTDELRNLIESLQGLSASRTEENPTLTAPQPPPIPVTAAGGKEAILWEQVSTGYVPLPKGPLTRPPPPHDPISKRIPDNLLKPPNHLCPSTPASTFTDVCSR